MARPPVSHKPSHSIVSQLEGSVGPRVLIIDDKKADALALTRALTENSLDFENMHCDVKAITNPSRITRYLHDDLVDVFIVDLKLKKTQSSPEDKELGNELVKKISQSSNAGVIVYSSEPIDLQSPDTLLEGADDYIAKGTSPKIIRARVFALWRRVQRLRPSLIAAFVHTNRIFQIGQWRFVVGSRELYNDLGDRIRISPTEHAFLSHVATVENHEIDREHFNVYVLGRETYHDDRRLDKLVSRLRTKLGDSLQIISNRNDGYKLVSIIEIGK